MMSEGSNAMIPDVQRFSGVNKAITRRGDINLVSALFLNAPSRVYKVQ